MKHEPGGMPKLVKLTSVQVVQHAAFKVLAGPSCKLALRRCVVIRFGWIEYDQHSYKLVH